MLVQCPNCKTTYKVSDEVLKGTTPAFRCSRCRHTFELDSEEAPAVAAQPRVEPEQEPVAPVHDQELSFSFPAKELEAAPDANFEAEPFQSAAPAADASVTKPDEQELWSMDGGGDGKAHTLFTLPDNLPVANPEKAAAIADTIVTEDTGSPLAGSDDEASNILPISSYMDQQVSITPYLTLFALLLMGFSLITVISYAHPRASEDMVKRIPLFGPLVLNNTHLKEGILIQSLRGGYQSVQGNREVFVVTGIVVNQNPVVVREIQLTGKVYNDAGKELEQQNVWIGNTISAKIIRGMTPEDIPHLQSLKPLKSFEMPPGDSVPFAMVFLKATKSAKDFSCTVALAQGEG